MKIFGLTTAGIDCTTARFTADNTGFASGGVMALNSYRLCKFGALCFYSNSVMVDSFVLRNAPWRKARKRCGNFGTTLVRRIACADVGVSGSPRRLGEISPGHVESLIRLRNLENPAVRRYVAPISIVIKWKNIYLLE